MAPPEAAAAAASRPPFHLTTWRGRAFGIEIEGNGRVTAVSPPVGPGLPRRVRLEFAPAESLRAAFPRGASVLAKRSFRTGRPMMLVEADPLLGYHMWAPGYGRHLVSPDGTTIRSSVSRANRRWERLMLAQPLPLCAVLQGLELFHASAVRMEPGIVAFLASSGTGKTSVAAHLVGGGACLVTDDILAVEATDGGVTAHAGGTVLHLAETELVTMSPDALRRLRRLEEQSDKIQVAGQLSTEPGPLAAAYFLTRSADFRHLQFATIAPPSPRQLLSSAFLSYLTPPSRMRRQLELYAQFVESVRTFEARVPSDFGAGRLAEAILAHTEREL